MPPEPTQGQVKAARKSKERVKGPALQEPPENRRRRLEGGKRPEEAGTKKAKSTKPKKAETSTGKKKASAPSPRADQDVQLDSPVIEDEAEDEEDDMNTESPIDFDEEDMDMDVTFGPERAFHMRALIEALPEVEPQITGGSKILQPTAGMFNPTGSGNNCVDLTFAFVTEISVLEITRALGPLAPNADGRTWNEVEQIGKDKWGLSFATTIDGPLKRYIDREKGRARIGTALLRNKLDEKNRVMRDKKTGEPLTIGHCVAVTSGQLVNGLDFVYEDWQVGPGVDVTDMVRSGDLGSVTRYFWRDVETDEDDDGDDTGDEIGPADEDIEMGAVGAIRDRKPSSRSQKKIQAKDNKLAKQVKTKATSKKALQAADEVVPTSTPKKSKKPRA